MEFDKEYFLKRIFEREKEYELLTEEQKESLKETAQLLSAKFRSQIMSSYELGFEYYFFYGSSSPFSQRYPAELIVDGIEYNCLEQYMMERKANLFKDEYVSKLILSSEYNPQYYQDLGRKVKGFDQEIWDKSKIDIVTNGNLQKFLQNSILKDQLLATGLKIMVEASPHDKIWGIGLSMDNEDRFCEDKWLGQNLLGYILTKVKRIIREVEEKKH